MDWGFHLNTSNRLVYTFTVLLVSDSFHIMLLATCSVLRRFGIFVPKDRDLFLFKDDSEYELRMPLVGISLTFRNISS